MEFDFSNNKYNEFFNKLNINDLIKNNIYSDYKLKQFKDIKYFSNFNKGISLCFKNDILDSIFLYNENIDKFHRYNNKLPYLINFDMKNVDIIQLLGDTPKKGGGNCPIFLNYPNLGIEINFIGKDWNDLNNIISFIILFNDNINDDIYCSVCTKKIDKNNKIFKCNNKNCNLVNYCSEKCKNIHIKFHLKLCTY